MFTLKLAEMGLSARLKRLRGKAWGRTEKGLSSKGEQSQDNRL